MRATRSATSVIWKTVVFAGAMLAAPGCKKSGDSASTMPTNNSGGESENVIGEGNPDPGMVPDDPCAGDPADDPCAGWEDPCAGDDPCAGRPRGGDDEGGVGRGFVLS